MHYPSFPRLPDSDIEIVSDVPTGGLRHALFDFDGTISLLRQGWEGVMTPVMIEMICGESEPSREIEEEVARFIDETTGIQTIVQMEGLVEMVRRHGRIPESEIQNARSYKAIYNDRLLVPVSERLAKLERGDLTVEEATVRGSLSFVRALHQRGLALYIFSGTDRDDVRNEARKLGASEYFREVWGALNSLDEYSKEMVLKEVIEKHALRGGEVLIVGDGPVEIRNAKEQGCVAVGVASDESTGFGWNAAKRRRLLDAGADILIPDFNEGPALLRHLFDR